MNKQESANVLVLTFISLKKHCGLGGMHFFRPLKGGATELLSQASSQ